MRVSILGVAKPSFFSAKKQYTSPPLLLPPHIKCRDSYARTGGSCEARTHLCLIHKKLVYGCEARTHLGVESINKGKGKMREMMEELLKRNEAPQLESQQ
jgi:hypothetical protein